MAKYVKNNVKRCQKYALGGTTEELRDAFQFLDENGDGLLSAQELQTVSEPARLDSRVARILWRRSLQNCKIAEQKLVGFPRLARAYCRSLKKCQHGVEMCR